MELPSESLLLRIFTGETDKFEGRPLYKAIVEEARKHGMAGATVLRGILGFGANSRIHTSQILRLSEDLPLIIEIVDTEDRINTFLPRLDEMINEGLVTLEKAQVITYRHNSQKPRS
jgi:PII-like signaling protein